MATRIMLAGLLIAQLGDAVTFAYGVARHGIHVESNGLAALLYRWNGTDGVILAKGAAILLILTVLIAGANRFPRLLIWGAATATGLGLLGTTANVVALAILA